MEDRVIKLELKLNELEKSNISLYINDVKKIKKNAIKLENEINKILTEDENNSEDENSESDKSISDKDIDIDEELKKYSDLICNLNETEINNKTIEELNKIYQEIITVEKNIKLYQRLNCDLNIKNL